MKSLLQRTAPRMQWYNGVAPETLPSRKFWHCHRTKNDCFSSEAPSVIERWSPIFTERVNVFSLMVLTWSRWCFVCQHFAALQRKPDPACYTEPLLWCWNGFSDVYMWKIWCKEVSGHHRKWEFILTWPPWLNKGLIKKEAEIQTESALWYLH